MIIWLPTARVPILANRHHGLYYILLRKRERERKQERVRKKEREIERERQSNWFDDVIVDAVKNRC